MEVDDVLSVSQKSPWNLPGRGLSRGCSCSQHLKKEEARGAGSSVSLVSADVYWSGYANHVNHPEDDVAASERSQQS